MLLEGQCPIKKEAQVVPHYLRPKNLLPHVGSHGEGDGRRIATPLSHEVEEFGLGVLHREPKVLNMIPYASERHGMFPSRVLDWQRKRSQRTRKQRRWQTREYFQKSMWKRIWRREC
jgi:hypothetical protein